MIVNSDAKVELRIESNRIELSRVRVESIQLAQKREKKVTGIKDVPNVHVIREDAVRFGDVHFPRPR